MANTCTAFTPTSTPTRTRTTTPTRTRTSTRTPTRGGRSLSINDVRFAEGHPAPFLTVTLSQAASVEVRVDYFTMDGTAIGELDYFPTSGTLVFAPGQTQQRIFVALRNDTAVEPEETFTVGLIRPFNASIARAVGTVTIVDDDTVGTMELVPEESSVDAGDVIALTLRWVHPVGWRGLDTIDLRLMDDADIALWVRFAEAAGTFALCNADDDCLPGIPSGGDEVLRAAAASLRLDGSEARGSGPTGPSVELRYSIGIEPALSGRELRVEAAATDDDGVRQHFAQIGTVMVVGNAPEQSTAGGGCTVAPAPARGAAKGNCWLALLALALLSTARRAFHGRARRPAGTGIRGAESRRAWTRPW